MQLDPLRDDFMLEIFHKSTQRKFLTLIFETDEMYRKRKKQMEVQNDQEGNKGTPNPESETELPSLTLEIEAVIKKSQRSSGAVSNIMI